MKKILLLILLSIGILIPAHSQMTQTFEALKYATNKATLIEIQTEDDIDLAFQKIKQAVVNYGFVFENENREFYFISIPMQIIGSTGNQYPVSFNVILKTEEEKTIIKIRGQTIDNEGTQILAYNLVGIGAKTTIGVNAFAIIYEVAKTYKNGTVYTKS